MSIRDALDRQVHHGIEGDPAVQPTDAPVRCNVSAVDTSGGEVLTSDGFY